MLTIYFIIFIFFKQHSSKIHDKCLLPSEFQLTYKNFYKQDNFESFFIKGLFLGQGSYGEVRKVKWGKKFVAVKKISIPTSAVKKSNLTKELNFYFQFENSAKISQIYACLQTEDNKYLYIIQELLYKDFDSIVSLNKFQSKGKRSRINLFIKIAEGIKELHDNRIVHSDLKPENIMAMTNQVEGIKIIDLGLAGYFNERCRGGSPSFNSPDKINEPARNNLPADDIYAFGLTIASMETSYDQLFEKYPNRCSMSKMTDHCYTILKNNVGQLLSAKGYGKCETEKIKKNFTCLVMTMINFTPSNRPNINQVISLLNEISKNYSDKPDDQDFVYFPDELAREISQYDDAEDEITRITAFTNDRKYANAHKKKNFILNKFTTEQIVLFNELIVRKEKKKVAQADQGYNLRNKKILI